MTPSSRPSAATSWRTASPSPRWTSAAWAVRLDWLTAGIVEQADDVRAALETLRHSPHLTGVPIGLFDHSQGGWVVLEAAAPGPGVAFVVTSSGPGVSPAEQERHAAADGLRRAGRSPADVESALTTYESMLESIRAGASYEDFQRALGAEADRRQLDHLRQVAFVPDSQALWTFAGLIIDYDPPSAMRRISCPVLALFGAEDRSVPVERSVAAYRDALGQVAAHVFPGADHRCQLGDPPRMAPGYLDILADEIHRYASVGRSAWGGARGF